MLDGTVGAEKGAMEYVLKGVASDPNSGVKVNLDVLNAQTQLFTTQRDLAAARYNYLLSTLKLRQAAGTLTSNDLLAINALLVK